MCGSKLGFPLGMPTRNLNFIDKVIPVLALLVAIPASLFLGPLVVIVLLAASSTGKLFGLTSLLALLGLVGICGLWLRAVIQPFFGDSKYFKRSVGVLLLLGVIPIILLTVGHLNKPGSLLEDSLETIWFFYALVTLGIAGSAMALHNFLPNTSSRETR